MAGGIASANHLRCQPDQGPEFSPQCYPSSKLYSRNPPVPRLPNPDEWALQAISEHLDDTGRLACAHCGQLASPEKTYGSTFQTVPIDQIVAGRREKYPRVSAIVAICASCRKENVFVRVCAPERRSTGGGDPEDVVLWDRRLYPVGRPTKAFPNTKEQFLRDYHAACATIEVSPEASACMSRRCLQNVLAHQGYPSRDLATQIDTLLAEDDPDKRLSGHLRRTVDAIRGFGNFGAHPITDKTTLQIIPVEPHEA